jgi:hypothetical protein
LAYDARYDVSGRARVEADYQVHRPGRIIERRYGPRESR